MPSLFKIILKNGSEAYTRDKIFADFMNKTYKYRITYMDILGFRKETTVKANSTEMAKVVFSNLYPGRYQIVSVEEK